MRTVFYLSSLKDEKKETKVDSEGEILHKGIAKRYFKKSFTIAEDVEVKGAELKDGLLKVSLERIVPEHKNLELSQSNNMIGRFGALINT